MEIIKIKVAIVISNLTAITNDILNKDEVIKMIINHLHSYKALRNTELLIPWTENLEKSSTKTYISIYPSVILSEKVDEFYSQAKDGMVDIIWTLIEMHQYSFQKDKILKYHINF